MQTTRQQYEQRAKERRESAVRKEANRQAMSSQTRTFNRESISKQMKAQQE